MAIEEEANENDHLRTIRDAMSCSGIEIVPVIVVLIEDQDDDHDLD